MSRYRILLLVAVASVLWLGLGAQTARADGLVVIDCPPLPVEPPVVEPQVFPPCIWGLPCPTPPIVRPRPRPDCAAYLSVKNHNVTVEIADQVARTHVQETFVNPSDYQLEGTYIFPLPEEATISDFAMWVDGKKLEGKVLDRDQARQIYEEIVRRRRDPALLEYVGRNAFQARIFPINPHSEKQVEISYSQVLKSENGLVKYLYPLNTEKFSPEPLANVTVNVNLKSTQAIKAVYSPSHPVSVARTDDFRATIGYEGTNVKPDRDFVLYYSTAAGEVGATLLSFKPDLKDDGFFLLLVSPQAKPTTDQVVAKDVILVLDTSGSMQGEKVEQARRALKYVLENLNPDDRFNVLTFSTGVVEYAHSLQPASARGEAERFVDRIAAGGSTDIQRALLQALGEADRERPTIVVFLTDGLPTSGELNVARILDSVDRAAGGNIRLFTFGVGDDVNTVLLDSLGEKHRGASAYVRPGEKIDETVQAFYAKVSTPVLSDVALDWGGAQVEDLYPYPLPDLFAGSQLLVTGRYRQSGPVSLVLKGSVNGELKTYSFGDLSLREAGGDATLAPLWATRKIGYLLAQVRLHGENKEAVDEIVALAVRYGIVTPYTSFLIEEDKDVLGPRGMGGAGPTSAPAQGSGQFFGTMAPAVGATAVAQAQANRALKEAETTTTESETVKRVGDRVFILRNGVWTDTGYDPKGAATQKVQFGSAEYFALLSAHPESGPVMALGDHVIWVAEGTAYEIVP